MTITPADVAALLDDALEQEQRDQTMAAEDWDNERDDDAPEQAAACRERAALARAVRLALASDSPEARRALAAIVEAIR